MCISQPLRTIAKGGMALGVSVNTAPGNARSQDFNGEGWRATLHSPVTSETCP